MSSMNRFHNVAGSLVDLSSNFQKASRKNPHEEFNNALIFSAYPLVDDALFEIIVDAKVTTWQGSLEIGLLATDPISLSELPNNGPSLPRSWILSGCVIHNCGVPILDDYGFDLNKINIGDRVGVMKTKSGELHIYVNGEDLGPADSDIPNKVWAVVNLYGNCSDVSIHKYLDDSENSVSISIPSQLETGADLGAAAASATHDPSAMPPVPIPFLLTFHQRCGSQIILKQGARSAERRRPREEFNNAVAITNRPLRLDEYFEIRVDDLVEKWSGSVEIGVTSHDPDLLELPATMTNLRSGTVMMSGNVILTNGRGNREQYTTVNLDSLKMDDTIGLVVRSDGELHFCFNGEDLGKAAELEVGRPVWGVVDLYGRTVKCTIIDPPDPRRKFIDQPLTRNTNSPFYRSKISLPTRSSTMSDDEDNAEDSEKLVFYHVCGSNVGIANNNRTCYRINNDEFNNGVAITNRTLRTGEIFTVRLDDVVERWAGSLEIGVTSISPQDIFFPSTMTDMTRGKTFMLTSNGVMFNGSLISSSESDNQNGDSLVSEENAVNFSLNGVTGLTVGQTLGVELRANRKLHFYLNGVDLGPVPGNVPPAMYGVVDLYGQASRVTCVTHQEAISLRTARLTETPFSTTSKTTSPTEQTSRSTSLIPAPRVGSIPPPTEAARKAEPPITFHPIHSRNISLDNNMTTALRPNPNNEFKNAIVMSSRPLQDDELFEVIVEGMVNRWSGSLEAGVTALKPEDIIFPETLSHMTQSTWMLSGSCVMKNGSTWRNDYELDMDMLVVSSRVGVMRRSNGSLHFFSDGYDMGQACTHVPKDVYAIFDLYGQCCRISQSPDSGSLMPDLICTPSLNAPSLEPIGLLRLAIKELREESSSDQTRDAFQRAVMTIRSHFGQVMSLMSGTNALPNSDSNDPSINLLSPSAANNNPAADSRTPDVSAALRHVLSMARALNTDSNQAVSGQGAGNSTAGGNAAANSGAREGIPLCHERNKELQSKTAKENVEVVTDRLHWHPISCANINGDTATGLAYRLHQMLLFSKHQIKADELIEIELKRVSYQENNLVPVRGCITVGLVHSLPSVQDVKHKDSDTGPVDHSPDTEQNRKIDRGMKRVLNSNLELPCSQKHWLIQGGQVVVDGRIVQHNYAGNSLRKYQSTLHLGLLYTEEGSLHLFVEGVNLGVAAENIPRGCHIVLDMGGQYNYATLSNSILNMKLPNDNPLRPISNNKLFSNSKKSSATSQNCPVDLTHKTVVDLSNAQTQQKLQNKENIPSNSMNTNLQSTNDNSSSNANQYHAFLCLPIGKHLDVSKSLKCVTRENSGFDQGIAFCERPIVTKNPLFLRIDETQSLISEVPPSPMQVSSIGLAFFPFNPVQNLNADSNLPSLIQELDVLFNNKVIHLVGNSLFHGQKKIRSNLSIDLDNLLKGDSLAVSICDNFNSNSQSEFYHAVANQNSHPTRETNSACEKAMRFGEERSSSQSGMHSRSPEAGQESSSQYQMKISLNSGHELSETLLTSDSVLWSQFFRGSNPPQLYVAIALYNTCKKISLLTYSEYRQHLNTLQSAQANKKRSAQQLNPVNQLQTVSSNPSANDNRKLITLAPRCSYLLLIERVKFNLCLPETFFRGCRSGVSEQSICTCRDCVTKKKANDNFGFESDNSATATAAKPNETVLLKESFFPIGWQRFALRVKRELRSVLSRWHVAFLRVNNPIYLRKILDMGDPTLINQQTSSLINTWLQCKCSESTTGQSGHHHGASSRHHANFDASTSPVTLIPFIGGLMKSSTSGSEYEVAKSSEESNGFVFQDPKSKGNYLIQLALEVRVKPGAYQILSHQSTPNQSSNQNSSNATESSANQNTLLADSSHVEWLTKERGAIILTALMIRAD